MFAKGQVHDYWEPPQTDGSRSLIAEMVGAARAENRAAAARLAAVGALFEMRRAERGEEPDWAVDTWAAVGAEVAAALRISLGRAGSLMTYGQAMRRLPLVAAVFTAGEIDLTLFTTIAYRTELITDPDKVAAVDAVLAARIGRWPSMTRGALLTEIDRVVSAHDRDAVRRTRERVRTRDLTVWDRGDGTADLSGRLFSTDAAVLDQRLDSLAATVCPADPRTREQRRADALGALAAGAQRLRCRCESPMCPAAVAVAAPVVIHVVAHQSTLDGTGETPGYLMGPDSLISAEVLRELAADARRRPLLPPGAAPEPNYRPSRALADFVRARDLTCRAPGCDRPAVKCQLDHTVPHAEGGATHASNIKCLCVFHHLIKTFWGWKDRQLPDGTVIWTLPGGRTYVTTPGSALLFPALLTPTGDLPTPKPRKPDPQAGDRSARMPRRTRSRAKNRAHRITTERTHNRQLRHQREAERIARLQALGFTCASSQAFDDDDEPPF